MAVSHIFSSPVANITGTVTVFDTAGGTKTEAASNIVQPQHWNSVHNQFVSLYGNTAGQSTLSGTNLVFAGGPNVTLSANAGTISISGGAGGAGDGGNILAAGTRTAGSNSSVLFSNANGLTFGLDAVNGSIITASHNALTTARASNDAVGLNTALTANGVAWTVNSAGLSLNVPAFLTTAMLSNAVTLSNIRVSAGTASNLLSAITFSNANGVTFGLNGSVVTGSHDGLTTARASNDGVGLNTALTANGVAWTVNSSGVSLNVPAFLTTAMLSNAVTLSNIRISAGSTSNLASAFTFSNSNGVSFGLNAGTITAAHNGLTTARASNDGVGLNTAQTNVTWTVNSAGISLNAGGYLTTAALSNHSHGNPTLALTNLSGTTASNSAGLTLSLSAAAPGGGGAINVSAGTTSGNVQTLEFSNGSGVSWGLNGSTITASVNAGGAAAFTRTHYDPFNEMPLVIHAISQGSFYVQPCFIPNVAFDRLVFPCNFSGATNSTGSMTVSFRFGLYTRDDTKLSLVSSTSHSFSILHSGTASSATWVGPRLWTMPWTSSIAESGYYIGIGYSTATGGANLSFSVFANSHLNSSLSGILGAASNATAQLTLGLGRYTAATAAAPNSIAFSQIQGVSSAFRRNFAMYFASSTA